MKPAEATARRRAREAALQMLYQWEIGRSSPGDTILTYWPAQEEAPDLSEEHREIDGLLAERAQNWRVERMAVLDRLVLRLATYEMLAEPATPAKVIINEALELTRQYSGDEAVAFVNGVLDGVRKQLGRE